MTLLNADRDLQENLVTTEEFRDAAGHFASGVTVIGTSKGHELFGTTASAVLSLSMEPPMMLVCLNRSSTTHDAVVETGEFSISILSQDQGHLARHFASKSPDKFNDLAVNYLQGLPVVPEAITAMTCSVDTTTVGGTHTVFLGRVTGIETAQGQPLTYYRGGFGAFVPKSK